MGPKKKERHSREAHAVSYCAHRTGTGGTCMPLFLFSLLAKNISRFCMHVRAAREQKLQRFLHFYWVVVEGMPPMGTLCLPLKDTHQLEAPKGGVFIGVCSTRTQTQRKGNCKLVVRGVKKNAR